MGKLEVGDRPLIPGLGEPRSVVDQRGRAAQGVLMLLRLVQPNDGLELLALDLAAGAAPDGADAVFGEHADAAVAIDQGPAEHGVRLVVADESQRQNRPAARGRRTMGGQPLERGRRVSQGDLADEAGRVFLEQELAVQ